MDRPRPPDQPDERTPAERQRQRRADHIRRNEVSTPWRHGADAPRPAPDAPGRSDHGPDRPRRWYAPHEAREHGIERQRRDQAPAADPQQWRDDWYRRHGHDVPAPFRPDVAALVPDASQRTKGRLDRHDGGGGIPIDSGRKTGLTDALEKQLGRLPDGFTSQNKAHAEAHAAAYLWLNPHIREATLYINHPLCPGPRGCRERLPGMLPDGRTLTIYAPYGVAEVYHGHATPPRQP